ncbi:MAG: hypothetical protein EAZ81_10840 [Verrucomicrobia bacterium]|nr:MAG: hypothetical protein EAZ81_10840 [Verrucomicrobiota bacterium]
MNPSDFLIPALSAITKHPYDFALDLVRAPKSSHVHYSRAVANLASAAASAAERLTTQHPDKAELIRSSIIGALSTTSLNSEDFTTFGEGGRDGLPAETVRANLTRVCSLLAVQTKVLIDAAVLLDAKSKTVKGGQNP